MTTRAVLARPRGADPRQFVGVYLHNAAGPLEMGPVLWTLMRDRYRFDAAGFWREMIDSNPAGWSNIDCLGGEAATSWDGTTKLTVEQHQANFNAGIADTAPTSFQNDAAREVPGVTEPPIDDTSDNWGADLIYVIGRDGLSILVEGAPNEYKVVTTLSWDDDEPDWDAADDELAEAYEAFAPEPSAPTPAVPQSALIVVGASAERIHRGDVAGAQKLLLDYLRDGGLKTHDVLGNLFFTLGRLPLPAAEHTALVDETLAAMAKKPELMRAALIENMCVVLNNLGRGAESLELCERAMADDVLLDGNCYIGFTYGAYASQDRAVMRRAIEHVERRMAENPEMLHESPAVFDNTAGIYVALGDVPKALEYVRLCKKYKYENFKAMPSMPEYASIKNDPEFKKLFR